MTLTMDAGGSGASATHRPAGLFDGLIAFPLTPLGPESQVDAPTLRRMLERIVDAEADAIGLLGSTGAYAYLTRDQRRQAVETAVAAVGGRMPIIVGVGALTTVEAALLARDARAAGADGLLLAPMSYAPLTGDEVFQHFLTVAEAGTLPLCIYNNPVTTRFSFSPDLVARLAQVQNVAAIKMPLPADGDFAGELARLRGGAPRGFAVGYSGDWGAAAALLAGCDAWYSVVAGLLPDHAAALIRAARAGNAAKVMRMDEAFLPLWGLFKAHGSFRVMYAMADHLGLAAGAPPRPILPLPPAVCDHVAEALQALDEVGIGS